MPTDSQNVQCNGPFGDEEACPVHGAKISAARAKYPYPLDKLLAMLDATTVHAAVENLEHHFGKDAKVIEMFLVERRKNEQHS